MGDEDSFRFWEELEPGALEEAKAFLASGAFPFLQIWPLTAANNVLIVFKLLQAVISIILPRMVA